MGPARHLPFDNHGRVASEEDFRHWVLVGGFDDVVSWHPEGEREPLADHLGEGVESGVIYVMYGNNG